MRIHSRLIIILVCVTCIFVSGLVVITQRTRAATALAMQGRATEMHRMLGSVLDLYGDKLAVLSTDHTHWDEMVEFLDKRDPAWAAHNLDASLETFDAQALWVYDSEFRPIYTATAEGCAHLAGEAPAAAVLRAAADARHLSHFFAPVAGGHVEFRCAGIHPTTDVERATPPRGYLLVGRLWDPARVAALSRALGSSVSVVPAGERSASGAIPGALATVHDLRGYDGRPVGALRIIVPSPALDPLMSQPRAIAWLGGLFVATVLCLLAWLLVGWVGRPLRLIHQALVTEDPEVVAEVVDGSTELGRIAGLIGEFFRQRERLVTALSEQEETAAALSTSEQRYRSLFEHSNDAILIHDLRGNIVDANGRAVDLLGYDVGELRRLGLVGLQTAAELEATTAAFEETRTGGHARLETRMRRVDGVMVDVEMSVRITDRATGTVQGVVRDISDWKRAESILLRQRDLSWSLLSAATLDEALELCLCGALEASGMDAGGIYLPGPTNGSMELRHHRGISADFAATVAEVSPEMGPPQVWAGEPFYDGMAAGGPSMLDPRVRAEGLRASGLIPVRHEGRAVALLNVASHLVDDIPEPSRRAAEAIAAQMAATISRFQAHTAIAQREAQLSGFFSNASVGLAVLAPDGRIVRANPLFGEMGGREPGARLRGEDAVAVLGERDRRRLNAAVARVADGAGPVRLELSRTIADGVTLWYDVSLSPIMGEGGDVVALAMIVSDITERRRVEDALRTSEAKYRIIFETSPEAIALIDADGRVVEVNSKVREWLGDTWSTVVGCAVWELPLVGATERRHLAEALRRRLAGESLPPYHLEFALPDGDVRLGRVSGSAIRGEDGAVQGAIALIADVTEFERLQAKLRQAQKLESLGVLAGGIAHDFNNLLQGIMGNTELALMRLPEEAPGHKCLKAVESLTQRAAHLAGQMLAYSGQSALIAEPVDVATFISDCAERLRQSLPPNVRLVTTADPDVPAVMGDRQQLEQVLQSLVTNAAEAIGDRRGQVTIATGAAHLDRKYLASTYIDEDLPDGEYVSIEVQDDGAGMDTATASRIFDPFFTTKFAGRGLGLAAALGIVRGHRGAINVYSEPGHGTVVKALLPAAETRRDAPTEPPAERRGTATALILLVDDEPEVRELGEAVLQSHGFTVLTAADGEEAVAVARRDRHRIGLVLMDLTMPGIGGDGALEVFRSELPQIPVIVCSGFGEEAARKRLGDKAVAGFLRKPYSVRQLLEAVDRALGDEPDGSRPEDA